MSEFNLTLRGVIGAVRKRAVGGSKRYDGVRPSSAGIKRATGEGGGEVDWGGVSDVLKQKATKLLDISVLDVLLRVRRKCVAVKKQPMISILVGNRGAYPSPHIR